MSIGFKDVLNVADIYNYFSRFSRGLEKSLKQLFKDELHMLVLEPGSNEGLCYWDLLMM